MVKPECAWCVDRLCGDGIQMLLHSAFTTPFSLCTLMVCCTDSPALDHNFVHFPRGARWGRLAITCVEDVDYLERKVEVREGKGGMGSGSGREGEGWGVGGKGGVESGRKERGGEWEEGRGGEWEGREE